MLWEGRRVSVLVVVLVVLVLVVLVLAGGSRRVVRPRSHGILWDPMGWLLVIHN